MVFDDNNTNDPDLNVFMKCEQRERAWEEFLRGYLKNKIPLSDEQILEFLGSIQEYLYLDRPTNYYYNPYLVFNAFDAMARIANALARNTFGKKDSDLRDYVSKNLFLCMSFLKRAEEEI